MSRIATLIAAAALAAALCSCASSPSRSSGQAGAAAGGDAGAAAAQEREVAWDESVRADFEREVPRFAQKLARSKLEEMARDKGTYFVDRAVYDEAMAQYKR